MELVSAPRLRRALTQHRHPAPPHPRPLRQHVQQNVRRPDRYRQGRCRTRTSPRFPPPRREPVPPFLLFLAGSWVIRYEALQENGRLLLDASVPLLDVVKSWAPVSGHTSQGLNANYSKRGKVWYMAWHASRTKKKKKIIIEITLKKI